MKSLSKAHIVNQTWKLLLSYISLQLWIHFVYLFIKVITTFRACLHVVKGKNHRQSTSWIVAILNRKRYQICFFFHFMIYTDFLILSSLYTTYFRNEKPPLATYIPSSAFHPTEPYLILFCVVPTHFSMLCCRYILYIRHKIWHN